MTEKATIDAAWRAIERGWEIESREWFEQHAPKMGFATPLEMAVHHMWKRETKPKFPVALVFALTTVGFDDNEMLRNRTVGLFATEDDARHILTNNLADLNEAGWYPYAVIERVEVGVVYPMGGFKKGAREWWAYHRDGQRERWEPMECDGKVDPLVIENSTPWAKHIACWHSIG